MSRALHLSMVGAIDVYEQQLTMVKESYYFRFVDVAVGGPGCSYVVVVLPLLDVGMNGGLYPSGTQ